jgi:hypothetical protein
MNSLQRWLAVGAAAAVVAAGGVAEAGHDKALSAGKLAREPSRYYGQTVTVSAEVEDVLGNHAFTLDEDAVFAGPDVLVLLPQGRALRLREDEKVTVTGTVRRYVVAELNRDFDWFKDGKILKSEVEVDYESRPVLVAAQVMSADGRDLLSGPADAMTGDSDVPTASTRSTRPLEHEVISATRLVNDPKKYYGQTVSVRSEVEKVLSANSFTLDEDSVFKGPDVLVLLPRGVASRLSKDQQVTVTGTVRPWVVADLDRDLDFFDEGKIINTETEVDWKTRPVLVATSVVTADGRDLLASAP